MESIKNERIGMSMMMNCGMKATILEYRNRTNIDVQFEDGAIVKHREFKDFQKGQIANPNQVKEKKKTTKCKKKITKRNPFKEREGMSLMMNCGMKATIIAYHNSDNIDVQFEDGTIVKHRQFRAFQKGGIKPTYLRSNVLKDYRMGETRIMNCGMKATIIKYVNCDDATVKFEDGYISEHVKYQCFVKGAVHNPKAYGIIGISKNEYALQYILKSYGFHKAKQGSLKSLGLGRLELDLYNPNLNGHKVAIEYDGYFTRKHSGHIKDRDLKKNEKCRNANITLIRIREPQLCDLDSTSIDYKLNSSDIMSRDFLNIINQIINFLNENFEAKIPIVKEIPKDDILLNFAHECYGYNHSNRKGTTLMMNCGMKATILEYRNRTNIDVQFEDGTIVKHREFKDFQKGQIANPNQVKEKKKTTKCKKKITKRNPFKEREGMSLTMNCGMKATIIEYHNSHDIDIQFEDGTIAKHRNFGSFKKGQIANPNQVKEREGMTLMMNCGMKATIIAYHNSNNIDVQFEDGTIVKHRQFGNFQKGEIANPNQVKERKGMSLTMNCGMKATILEYRNRKDIDIQFEDGIIVKHRQFGNFQKGEIANPSIKINRNMTSLSSNKKM